MDQMLAAVDEVDSICGANEHLLNDELIGRIVEFAAKGRHTWQHDFATGGSPIESRPRVFNATALGPRTLDAVVQPDTLNLRVACGRCDRRVRSSETRRVWVPAGIAVIELDMCPECVEYLDRDFAPVVWEA